MLRAYIGEILVVSALVDGRHLRAVVGEEAEQALNLRDAVVVVARDELAEAGLRAVRRGSAERLEVDDLAGHLLDDLRPGYEGLARLVDHYDEVGERRRVTCAARAASHDGGNLRDDARRVDVVVEDRAVDRRAGAFLEPAAARVVEADDGDARFERELLHPRELQAVHLAHRAAEHGRVLRVDEGSSAVDEAVARHDAVGGRVHLVHAEARRARLDEHVVLDEGAGVEEQIDALSRGQLAFGVLLVDPLLPALKHDVRFQIKHSLKTLIHLTILPIGGTRTGREVPRSAPQRFE